DLYCTLSNENQMLNGGNTATIKMAKELRVLARNNTTETADVSPADTGPVRNYTIQATPRMAALTRLAQKLGAEFSMVAIVRPDDRDESGNPIRKHMPMPDKEEMNAEVSTGDLAKLFRIIPPEPEWSFTIDQWGGTNFKGSK